MKRIWIILFSALTIIVILWPIFYIACIAEKEPPGDFYFGVSFGLKKANEAKLLIDRVKDYTNFFLVDSWDIATNETALNEVCDYAAEANLSFMVFFDFISFEKAFDNLDPQIIDPKHNYTWQQDWVASAKDRWGDKFLGIYIYEEPGGKQIDTGLFDELHGARGLVFENVTSYSEAARVFVNELPKGWSFHYLQQGNISKFVSDYALYWFDYMAGYDAVFAEIGFSHNTKKHIGLCRGAATAQKKDWGAIIVWNNKEPPIFKTGPEMFRDMLTAYESGAKYVIIFNFPQNPPENHFGILTDEHFSAMEQFWAHVRAYPKDYGKTEAQVAFVLPEDYGWGMRRPDDLIWGLWPADDLSPIIWEKMNKLIDKYGLQLDIVYNDPLFNFTDYSEVFFWHSGVD